MFLSLVPKRSPTSYWDTTLRHQAEARVEWLEKRLDRILDAYITPSGDGHFSVQLPGWGTRVATSREDARAMILHAIEAD